MNKIEKIGILVDDSNSWFVPYAKLLMDKLNELGYVTSLYHNSRSVPELDVCFLLSCTKIVKKEFLSLHKHNIVVHASDLPKGKGFTPMKWQILEGCNDVPLTLFEAVEACDAGPYYFKDYVHYEGYEMLEQLQKMMAQKIIEMCTRFVIDYENMVAKRQVGESTYYSRFTKEDDCLDVNKTLADHFNHFRIADNERFPLSFEYKGHKFNIVVSPKD